MFKKRNSIVFFIIYCLLSCYTYAQSIDSLRAVWNNGTELQKLKSSVLLTKVLSIKKFSETIQITEQAIPIAINQKDTSSWASLLCSKGIAHYFSGEYDQAAACYFDAVALLENNAKSNQLAEVYELIARLYRKTNELTLALDYYQRAMLIYSKKNYKRGMATIYNESGVVYEYQKSYDIAISNYKKSLGITEQLNDKAASAYALSNLGTVYRLINQFSLGEQYLKHALSIRHHLQDTFAIALNLSDLGLIYQAWGKFEKSIEAFDESNTIAHQLNYKDLLSANYKNLALVYASIQKYDKAFQYQNLHKAISDSIFTEQRAAQVAELQTKYETQKKDIAIAEQANALRRKQFQLVGALISILVLVIIVLLWYNQIKLKQKALHQQNLLEKQVLTNQVMMEAEEKERKRIAQELHDGVGQQLSAAKLNLSAFQNKLPFEQQDSFTRMIQLVDDAVKEVRQISHNMMPGALQKQGLKEALDDFIFKLRQATTVSIELEVIGFDKRLHATTETVLYRVVQESVNNALKHAQANIISIQLVGHDDYINLMIQDDGVGFDKNNSKNGIGLKNLTSRVELIGGTIEFDSTPGNGTTVVVNVPVLLSI